MRGVGPILTHFVLPIYSICWDKWNYHTLINSHSNEQGSLLGELDQPWWLKFVEVLNFPSPRIPKKEKQNLIHNFIQLYWIKLIMSSMAFVSSDFKETIVVIHQQFSDVRHRNLVPFLLNNPPQLDQTLWFTLVNTRFEVTPEIFCKIVNIQWFSKIF